MLNPNDTRIAAPRVPFLDPRTGLISREWYRYLFNLYGKTEPSNQSLDDVQKTPSELPLSDGEINKQIQALELGPVSQPYVKKARYGTFIDTTTQTAAAINTAYAITYNTTQISNGVYVDSGSKVYVDSLGTYNFQFSLEMTKSSGSLGYAYIWARVNNVDVPDSGSRIAFQGANSDLVAAWNFVLSLNANDYFELMWSVSSTNITVQKYSSVSPCPDIPSVILTVTDNISS